MLKQRARFLTVTSALFDLMVVAAAFFAAYGLRATVLPWVLPGWVQPHFYPLGDYLPLLPVVLAIWGAMMLATGRYRSHRTVPFLEEVVGLVKVCLAGGAILILAIYLLRLDSLLLGDDRISRLWVALLVALSFLLLLADKAALRYLLRQARRRGYNYRSVVIVGTSDSALEIADSIEQHPYWGFKTVGFVTNARPAPADFPARYPILGDVQELPEIVQRVVVDDVFFAVRRHDLERLEDIFLALEELGIRARFALNLFPHTKAKAELEDLDGVPLLTFSTGPTSHFQLVGKRALDLALSGGLLVVTLPLICLIAVLIKITSRGPVLFSQRRCGLNGRRFVLYKFRTMIPGAEERLEELRARNEMDGPVFKLRRDPRVTSVGRLLRKFSLDELPQLWNVLKGDMSLVGPRPPLPEEVVAYERWQRRRLSMKPGLTCLWQISGRNEVDFERWMELDLEYIDTWTPLLDLKILAKTIPVVLSGRGAS